MPIALHLTKDLLLLASSMMMNQNHVFVLGPEAGHSGAQELKVRNSVSLVPSTQWEFREHVEGSHGLGNHQSVLA